LEEANYDPKNVIKISGRAARIPKLVEVYEAMHGYLETVGMNVEINVVEPSVRNDLRRCAIGKAVNEVLEARGKTPVQQFLPWRICKLPWIRAARTVLRRT
jgi:hypothetical protein